MNQPNEGPASGAAPSEEGHSQTATEDFEALRTQTRWWELPQPRAKEAELSVGRPGADARISARYPEGPWRLLPWLGKLGTALTRRILEYTEGRAVSALAYDWVTRRVLRKELTKAHFRAASWKRVPVRISGGRLTCWVPPNQRAKALLKEVAKWSRQPPAAWRLTQWGSVIIL